MEEARRSNVDCRNRGVRFLSSAVDEDTDCDLNRRGEEGSPVRDNNTNNKTTCYDWEEMRAQEEAVAQRQTATVWRMKLFLASVLVLSTLGCAFGVFRFARRAEHQDFEDQFESAAHKVLESIGESIDITLGATDSLAVSMASYARATQQSWPFVTLPDFYLRTKKVHGLSKSIWTTVYHLVQSDQRKEWENYTTTHNDWIDADLAVQATDKTYHGPIITEYENFNVIHGWDEYGKDDAGKYGTDRAGPYLVNWQNAPVIPHYPVYNWDLLSLVYNASAEEVMYKGKVVITEPYLIPDPNNPEEMEEAEITADWAKDYIGPEEDPMEPMSDIMYPIYNDVSRVDLTDDNLNTEAFVAILAISIYWRDMFKDTLTPGAHESVAVVIENKCTSSFTYQIDGPNLTYLGRGDQHDEAYDDIQIATTLEDLFCSGDCYTGVPVNHEYCPFHIRVYPTSAMEDGFKSNKPTILTVVTVLIFAFTSVVFVLYDCAATHNVVTLGNLVQKRTTALEESNMRLEKANRRILQASAAQLKHFACMSHEIRTPLNGIVGVASLLEETELDEMQQESLRMITESSGLLQMVVDDVLDYSKLESGVFEVDCKRCNLQELLDGVVPTMVTKANERNIHLQTMYDTCVGEWIRTDKRRLQQILYNLLGNAVKFSKEKDVVDFGITVCNGDAPAGAYSPSHERASHNTTALPQKVLRFTIKDHGKGISKESVPKIFEPFSQESVETGSVYGGTGLGLAITSKLVDRLQGRLYVKSKEGCYSKFTVDLPLDEHPLDPASIVEDIKNTTVFFICKEDDTILHMSAVFSRYKIPFHPLPDLQSLRYYSHRQDDLCACIVDEDIYDREEYEQCHPCNCVLVSFGPMFSVKEALAHYRSVTQVLPGLFLRKLANLLSGKREKTAKANQSQGVLSGQIKYEDLRLLIAEDNKVNQKVITRIVSRLGVKCIDLAKNGLEAIEKEAINQYDIVLMDNQMPVMDGIEACRQICNREGGHKHPEIVFVTAHVSESFKKACLLAGAKRFLAKPCSLQSVQQCINDVVLGRV